MPFQPKIIYIQPQAASKPVLGAPCNGCGLCCLVEPCPVGILVSRRRSGRCVALRWQEDAPMYRCGALTHARQVLQTELPPRLAWLSVVLAPLLRALAQRWISAGQGCDSSLEYASLQDGPGATDVTDAKRRDNVARVNTPCPNPRA